MPGTFFRAAQLPIRSLWRKKNTSGVARSADPMVSQCSESRVQFRFCCRTDDKQLSSEHFRRVLHVLDVVGHIRIGRVHQKSHGHGVGRGFMQHLKLLSRDCAHEKSNARDVALRLIHAGNQTEFDGIAPRRREDDRNRRSCRLGGKRGGGPPGCSDHVDVATHEIGCQFLQSTDVIVGPPVLNRDVSVLDETGFGQSFSKCRQAGAECARR